MEEKTFLGVLVPIQRKQLSSLDLIGGVLFFVLFVGFNSSTGGFYFIFK